MGQISDHGTVTGGVLRECIRGFRVNRNQQSPEEPKTVSLGSPSGFI